MKSEETPTPQDSSVIRQSVIASKGPMQFSKISDESTY